MIRHVDFSAYGPKLSTSSSPIFSESSGILREYEEQQLLETRTLNGAVETPLKEVEEVGKGLRNEIGQYNCFLNVVIQVSFAFLNPCIEFFCCLEALHS